MKKISIFCPQCKKKLEIPLPPSLTQKINEKKVHHFPVPYKYIHGTPPHGITIYIDAHFKTRSYEIVEEVGFDQKEFKKISKWLWWTLFYTTEWAYLGLWDILAMKQYRNPFYKFYGKNYYWKVMSISLKGSEHENKKQQLTANHSP